MRHIFLFTHNEARLVFKQSNTPQEQPEQKKDTPGDGEKKSSIPWKEQLDMKGKDIRDRVAKLKARAKEETDKKKLTELEKTIDQSQEEMDKFIKDLDEGHADIVRGLDQQLNKLQKVLLDADAGRVAVEKDVNAKELASKSPDKMEPARMERTGQNEWKVLLKPGQRMIIGALPYTIGRSTVTPSIDEIGPFRPEDDNVAGRESGVTRSGKEGDPFHYDSVKTADNSYLYTIHADVPFQYRLTTEREETTAGPDTPFKEKIPGPVEKGADIDTKTIDGVKRELGDRANQKIGERQKEAKERDFNREVLKEKVKALVQLADVAKTSIVSYDLAKKMADDIGDTLRAIKDPSDTTVKALQPIVDAWKPDTAQSLFVYRPETSEYAPKKPVLELGKFDVAVMSWNGGGVIIRYQGNEPKAEVERQYANKKAAEDAKKTVEPPKKVDPKDEKVILDPEIDDASIENNPFKLKIPEGYGTPPPPELTLPPLSKNALTPKPPNFDFPRPPGSGTGRGVEGKKETPKKNEPHLEDAIPSEDGPGGTLLPFDFTPREETGGEAPPKVGPETKKGESKEGGGKRGDGKGSLDTSGQKGESKGNNKTETGPKNVPEAPEGLPSKMKQGEKATVKVPEGSTIQFFRSNSTLGALEGAGIGDGTLFINRIDEKTITVTALSNADVAGDRTIMINNKPYVITVEKAVKKEQPKPPLDKKGQGKERGDGKGAGKGADRTKGGPKGESKGIGVEKKTDDAPPTPKDDDDAPLNPEKNKKPKETKETQKDDAPPTPNDDDAPPNPEDRKPGPKSTPPELRRAEQPKRGMPELSRDPRRAEEPKRTRQELSREPRNEADADDLPNIDFSIPDPFKIPDPSPLPPRVELKMPDLKTDVTPPGPPKLEFSPSDDPQLQQQLELVESVTFEGNRRETQAKSTQAVNAYEGFEKRRGESFAPADPVEKFDLANAAVTALENELAVLKSAPQRFEKAINARKDFVAKTLKNYEAICSNFKPARDAEIARREEERQKQVAKEEHESFTARSNQVKTQTDNAVAAFRAETFKPNRYALLNEALQAIQFEETHLFTGVNENVQERLTELTNIKAKLESERPKDWQADWENVKRDFNAAWTDFRKEGPQTHPGKRLALLDEAVKATKLCQAVLAGAPDTGIVIREASRLNTAIADADAQRESLTKDVETDKRILENVNITKEVERGTAVSVLIAPWMNVQFVDAKDIVHPVKSDTIKNVEGGQVTRTDTELRFIIAPNAPLTFYGIGIKDAAGKDRASGLIDVKANAQQEKIASEDKVRGEAKAATDLAASKWEALVKGNPRKLLTNAEAADLYRSALKAEEEIYKNGNIPIARDVRAQERLADIQKDLQKIDAQILAAETAVGMPDAEYYKTYGKELLKAKTEVDLLFIAGKIRLDKQRAGQPIQMGDGITYKYDPALDGWRENDKGVVTPIANPTVDAALVYVLKRLRQTA